MWGHVMWATFTQRESFEISITLTIPGGRTAALLRINNKAIVHLLSCLLLQQYSCFEPVSLIHRKQTPNATLRKNHPLSQVQL